MKNLKIVLITIGVIILTGGLGLFVRDYINLKKAIITNNTNLTQFINAEIQAGKLYSVADLNAMYANKQQQDNSNTTKK